MLKEKLKGSTSFRGAVAVRADSNPAALIADIKSMVEEMRSKQDAFEKEVKSFNKEDVVRKEEVERINSDISAKIDQLGEAQKELAERHAALSLSGSGADNELHKVVKAFNVERGLDVSADDYQAFRDGLPVYLRKGADATPNDVRAAMQIGSDPAGGYTVPPDMGGRIAKKVFESTPMRQLANVLTIGTDRIEGFNDLNEANAGWVGEGETRPETSTPDLGKYEIPVHEVYAQPKATQRLLDDSMFDVEGWLENKISDKFARVENTAFITGDGVNKPRGILSYNTAATNDDTRGWGVFQHIVSGASGAFAESNPGDALITLVFALKAAYRRNANFLMSRSTLADIRKIKDGDGNYLWQPDFTQRQNGTLLGFGIEEGEDMPALDANSLSIAFGDFNETYTIVDRVGIRMLRDPFTDKGRVKFYSTKRVGGGAENFEALKFMKFTT